MTYALIDNATLTAVQRLLGQAKTRSLDSTDGDIVALENLIQAILFYDDVLCVDNYKDEYREARKKQFRFIRFLDPGEFHLDSIEQAALKESAQMVPEIRGGEFADENFKRLLEQLKLHMICTWDISSSTYYLNMKMLGQPDTPEFAKHGVLSATIFSELVDSSETDAKIKIKPKLVDRQGNPVTSGYKIPGAKWPGDGVHGGISGGLKAFIAALGWLSFKSLYYMNAARYLQADIFLYPIRQAFQINYMEKRGVYGYDFTKSIVSRMVGTLSGDMRRVISSDRASTTNIDLPMFSAWLIMECGSVEATIKAALELRSDERIRTARAQLKEVRVAFDAGELVSANKNSMRILEEVEKSSGRLISEFGLKTASGYSVNRLVQVYNTVAAFGGWPKMPSFDFKVKLPKVFSEKIPRRGFSALYRDISRDLAQVWGMGEARDRLAAGVLLEKDLPVFNLKTEDPKYRNAHSQWKSPM